MLIYNILVTLLLLLIIIIIIIIVILIIRILLLLLLIIMIMLLLLLLLIIIVIGIGPTRAFPCAHHPLNPPQRTSLRNCAPGSRHLSPSLPSEDASSSRASQICISGDQDEAHHGRDHTSRLGQQGGRDHNGILDQTRLHDPCILSRCAMPSPYVTPHCVTSRSHDVMYHRIASYHAMSQCIARSNALDCT